MLATTANRAISALAAIGTLGIAARALPRQEFGLVATLVSVWLILTLLDLGLGATLSTRVASAHGRDDTDEIALHVRDGFYGLSAIGAVVAVAGTVSAFVLPWGEWVGGAQPSITVTPAVVLMFVAAGAAMPGVVGIAALAGRQQMATAQILLASSGVATLGAAGLAAYLSLPPWGFLLAILGCPTAISLAITVRVLRVTHRSSSKPYDVDPSRVWRSARDSGYLALMGVGNAVGLGTGTLIVAVISGPGPAAIFSVASRMYTLAYTIVTQAGAQMWPALAEAIARRDFVWARSRYVRSVTLVSGAAVILCVTIVVFGKALARLWVGDALVPSTGLLVALGAFTLIISATGQAGTLLLATERVRGLALICVANALTSAGAAVILAQAFGSTGAAVGAALSCALVLAPGIYLLVRVALCQLEVS